MLPARPIKPRDKAKVEGGVLIAQRWILARLRNVTCFSLDELNEHIAALMADLNNRVMKRYGKSRRELFEDLDRPALIGLPADRFLDRQRTGFDRRHGCPQVLHPERANRRRNRAFQGDAAQAG